VGAAQAAPSIDAQTIQPLRRAAPTRAPARGTAEYRDARMGEDLHDDSDRKHYSQRWTAAL
jgi:hypothetical protein